MGRMTGNRELRRRLEAVAEIVDGLDADLAAGRLGAGEHALRRAEQEREAGRLWLDLRHAQRAARAEAPETDVAVTAPARRAWPPGPLVLVPAIVVVVALGVALGVMVGRGGPARPGGTPPGAGTASANLPPAVVSQIEQQALRQAVAREDAPVATLLQYAHAELDAGRLDEARRVYDRVLARDPRNVEAITHLGALLHQEGQADAALARVEQAIGIDPRYVHALWDRVQYLHARRDAAATARAAEAFLRVVPDGPDADNVKRILAGARR
jgi:tetratricopeptide (TPR) repeat protein